MIITLPMLLKAVKSYNSTSYGLNLMLLGIINHWIMNDINQATEGTFKQGYGEVIFNYILDKTS